MKKINKEELKKIYRSNTNKEVCKMLDISLPTLLRYLKEFGIKRKGKGNPLGAKRKIELVNE
jgi:hypothetical protein